MEERKQEFRTGLAIVIGLVILSGLIVFAGGLRFLHDYYQVKAKFPSAGGVKRGAPVRMSGVDIGSVAAIAIRASLDKQTYIEMTLELEQGYRIPTDSDIGITSDSMLGERFLEFTPGVAMTFLAAGETLPKLGTTPGTIDDALKGIPKIAESLQASLDNINKIIGDPRFQSDVRTAVENITTASGTLDSLLKEARAVVDENRGNVKTALGNLAEASEKARKFVDGLEGVKTEVMDSVKFVRAELAKFATSINDPALFEKIKKTLDRFDQMPDKLDSLVASLQKLADQEAPQILEKAGRIADDLHLTILQLKQDLAELAASAKATIELTRAGDGVIAALLTDKRLKEKLNIIADQGMYLLEHPVLFLLKGGYKERREPQEPKDDQSRPKVKSSPEPTGK
ncbi:MAG: MlaD family protein [Candidatus Brocadiia bacterium]